VNFPLREECARIWTEETQDLGETPPLGEGLRKFQGRDRARSKALLSTH